MNQQISEESDKIKELMRTAKAQREDPKNQWIYDLVGAHQDRRADPRQQDESNKRYALHGDLEDVSQSDSNSFSDQEGSENEDLVIPVNVEISLPKIKAGRLRLASKKKLIQKVISLYENRSPEQQRYFDQF